MDLKKREIISYSQKTISAVLAWSVRYHIFCKVQGKGFKVLKDFRKSQKISSYSYSHSYNTLECGFSLTRILPLRTES